MSAPACSDDCHVKRSWNCGSWRTVCAVLAGAMVVLCSSAKSIHSWHVRVRKMSRSSACSSLLPRAWSAMVLPGHFSNRSMRSTPSQKFFQNDCSDAMKRMCPSDAS